MVRYASLVVTKIMYNHDRKLGIQVGNCCFLLHVVRFVSYAPKEKGFKLDIFSSDLDIFT
jgi:hypothetical protein